MHKLTICSKVGAGFREKEAEEEQREVREVLISGNRDCEYVELNTSGRYIGQQYAHQDQEENNSLRAPEVIGKQGRSSPGPSSHRHNHTLKLTFMLPVEFF